MNFQSCDLLSKCLAVGRYSEKNTMVLSACLIDAAGIRRFGSSLDFSGGQAGCQNCCNRGVPSLVRRYLPALLCLLVVLSLTACDNRDMSELKQGDVFPRAELLQLERASDVDVTLDNKILVVNFWATWCEPCRKEMPALQRLHDSLDPLRYLVIGVSVDEDRLLMQEFLLQQGIRFPNFRDDGRRLAEQRLAIDSYPHTFVLSRQGRIVRRIKGVREWDGAAMQALLQSMENDEAAAKTPRVRE